MVWGSEAWDWPVGRYDYNHNLFNVSPAILHCHIDSYTSGGKAQAADYQLEIFRLNMFKYLVMRGEKKKELRMYQVVSFAENKNALCIWQGIWWKQKFSEKHLGRICWFPFQYPVDVF